MEKNISKMIRLNGAEITIEKERKKPEHETKQLCMNNIMIVVLHFVSYREMHIYLTVNTVKCQIPLHQNDDGMWSGA